MKQRTNLAIAFILALALGLRLYRIDTPLADWHSFRQADTASVAREFVKIGINLLQPRYHDLSNIQSGKDNPQGYRMVEVPFVNAFVALLSQFGPLQAVPLHIVYRLVNIALSLGSTYLIFLIVKKLDNPQTALLSALVFAILPYNVYYSRTVLPEVPLVFFSLLGLYLGVRAVIDQERRFIWFSAIAASLAMLLKPTAAFFFIPLAVLLFEKHKLKVFKHISWYSWVLIVITPFILWRLWIQNFPEGVPAFDWLLNGNGIRFKGAFFRWLFAERLGKLILGYWGLILFGFGLLTRHKSRFYVAWLFSMAAYLAIFATGNVQHDYYQIILIPIIAVYTGKGIKALLLIRSRTATALLLISLGFMLMFSWYEIRGYYQINNWAIVKAGEYADQNLPQDALVIAPYMGDTAFLYQANRRGWPIGFEIEDKIKKGAQYYLSTTYDDEARELEHKYTVVEKNSDFILIKLQ